MSEELTKTKLLPIQGKDMDSIMQNLETGVKMKKCCRTYLTR